VRAPIAVVIPAHAGIQYAGLLGSIAAASGILGRPVKPDDDSWGCVGKRSFAISRRVSPELCQNFPCPLNQRARGGRAPDAPDSRVCMGSG
jgi:hypothetical protein